MHATPPVYVDVKGTSPGYAAVLDRYSEWLLARRADGWDVVLLDDSLDDLDRLLDTLTSADRFIGNDSGPGHLAVGGDLGREPESGRVGPMERVDRSHS